MKTSSISAPQSSCFLTRDAPETSLHMYKIDSISSSKPSMVVSRQEVNMAPRSVSHARLHRETQHTPTLTMSTRSLPTPPPEGTAVPSTEADQATPQTTDIEEAAAPTNQPPPPQPQPTQLHTIYREVFPAIANKAIDKDWSGLAMLAELQDLRVSPRSHTFNRAP